MWGTTTGPVGGYIPDPLGQFLSRVVPWGTTPVPGFVNIHAWGGTMRLPPRGGGRAYADLGEYSQLASRVDYLNRCGSEVFFCLSLQSRIEAVDQHGNRRAERKAENAVQLRSFVLDLDVKPGAYASQREALGGLLTFCADLGLELGYVVSTGNGIHAYFTLDVPIDRGTWAGLASQLRNAATSKGLKFDAKVTVNPAQILRLPTSQNYKNRQNPLPCRVLQAGVVTSLSKFRDALKLFPSQVSATSGVTSGGRQGVSLDPVIFPPRPPITGPYAQQVIENIARGRVVTDHTLLYPACPVFADSFDRQGDGDPEPLWYTLAKLCQYVEDGRNLFHDLSSGDARYDPDLTDQKYDMVSHDGWPSCQTISDSCLAAGAICSRCAFNGQGNSPIHYAMRGLIGRLGTPSAGGQTPPGAPGTYVNGAPMAASGAAQVFNLVPQYQTIAIPQGYAQGSDFMIVRIDDNLSVFEMPLFDLELLSVRSNLDDSYEEMIKIVIDRGVHAGTNRNEFQISSKALATPRSLAEATFGRGLTCKDPVVARRFFMDWQSTIRKAGQASNHDRMGWSNVHGSPYGGFTYGGYTFTASGRVTSGMSKALQPLYMPRGNLPAWKQAASHLVGHGMVELETLIASSFASPLIIFTPEDGAVVFGRSSQSGVGKTAALVVNASVWGARSSIMQSADTSNAIYSRAAQLCNLPLIVDELVPTTQSTKNFNEIIMAISSGKEKSRLDRSSNDRPFRTWRTLLAAASNHSLIEQASTSESNAQAARVFEFPVPNRFNGSALARSDIAQIRLQLEENFGTAGLVYAEFLGRHGAAVGALVSNYMDEFQQKLHTRDDERFWVAVSSTIIAGASIAKKLGLLPFDLDAMWEFLAGNIRAQRVQVKDMGVNVEDPGTHIGRLEQFLNAHVRNQIHTDTMPPVGSNRYTAKMQVLNAAHLEHANFFVCRIGKTDQRMLVSKQRFADWCKANHYNFRQMMSVLIRDGLCTQPTNKRSLGAQANLMTQPAAEWLLEFDLTKPELRGFLP